MIYQNLKQENLQIYDFSIKKCYFLEPYTYVKSKIKFELDLSNYATKSHLKNATDVDALHFAKKADLASLKSDIDQKLIS